MKIQLKQSKKITVASDGTIIVTKTTKTIDGSVSSVLRKRDPQGVYAKLLRKAQQGLIDQDTFFQQIENKLPRVIQMPTCRQIKAPSQTIIDLTLE